MTPFAAGVAEPWAYVDPDLVAADIYRRHPQVRTVYLGEYTGSWWALVGDRLLEARSPRGLVEAIHQITAPPHQPPPVSGRRSPQKAGFGAVERPAGSRPLMRPECSAAPTPAPRHARPSRPRRVRRRRALDRLRCFFVGEAVA